MRINKRRFAAISASTAIGVGALALTACVPADCTATQGYTTGMVTCGGPTDQYRADMVYRATNGSYYHTYGTRVGTGRTSIAYMPASGVQVISVNVDY